jgi:hypothetical protein
MKEAIKNKQAQYIWMLFVQSSINMNTLIKYSLNKKHE